MGIRSFLAFELPVEIREQIRIISEELKKIALPVRWVKPNNIHLTILFLGSVDEDIIGDIEEKVNVAVRGFLHSGSGSMLLGHSHIGEGRGLSGLALMEI